jgi:hypothetical protein
MVAALDDVQHHRGGYLLQPRPQFIGRAEGITRALNHKGRHAKPGQVLDA